MKKYLRLALISVIISAMLVTHMPIVTLATDAVNTIKETKSIKNSDSQDTTGKKDSEVIIMYEKASTENNTNKMQTKKANSFLDGLTIEDTLTFENTEKAGIHTKSINTPDNKDLVVSLVKSDKYSEQELIDKLSNEKSIMYVQKNYKVKATGITNDQYEKYQWAIENIGQNNGTKDLDINPEKVKGNSSEEKVVAIIDTGVDYNHSELNNCLWNNPYASKNLLSGEHGYDFANNDEDPLDDNGHGTHVAGIIAAESNNNKGITGAVLNKSNIKIMPLKFLDSEGGGYVYGAISAYHYIYKAQKLGVNVVAINNSWGGSPDDDDDKILKTAINLVGKGANSDGKGALSICASGNEGVNTDDIINSPSCIDSNYIISVAASNEKDELAAFSNYGNNSVDLAAPGANILSTVSYNCFNPSIYEDKSKMCSQYESFDSDMGEFKYNISDGTTTTTSDVYFGNSGKSFQWEFESKAGKKYYLAIPYEVSSKSQHLSEMIRVQSTTGKDVGEYILYYDESDYNNIVIKESFSYNNIIQSGKSNENYWSHVETTDRKGGAIVILYTASADGKIRVNIDDFAISNSNISNDEFEKYDFYNGTSMATPYVTAAAAISSLYKENETAVKRKERIMGAVRKTPALSNKVMSGGVLDLTNMSVPTPAIESANIDVNGVLTIKTINIGTKTKLLINDKEVTPTRVNSKTLKIIDKKLINTTVKITLKESETNMVSKKLYLTAGKKYTKVASLYDVFMANNTFTDGKNIYIYTQDTKEVYKIEQDDMQNMYPNLVVGLSNNSLKQLLGEQWQLINYSTIIENTDFVIIDNKIYTIFSFDYGFAKDRVLAYYNIAKGDNVWRKFTKLPKGYNLSMQTLATYNSNLYLIGGYDESNNTVSKNVYELNIGTKKWTKKANLPEERFASKSAQVGNKLLISFGGKEDSKIPGILIFDGKSWKKSSAKLDFKSNSGTYKNKTYYSPEIGLVSGGLIISGINAEKYGDTFYYDISSDSYKTSGYLLNRDSETVGVSLGNKYYIFDKYMDYEREDISVYSIPVKTGLTKLTITYPKSQIKPVINAKLRKRNTLSNNKNSDIYYYLPGQKMSVDLAVSNGYYIKNFKVDGKAVNADKYSGIITKNRNIEVTADKNSNLIKLNKTSANLSAFKTLKLTATVQNKAASAIKWKSSNTNYATVSSTGVVTPKWAGCGKTVTITASTTINGKTASVKSKINIKKPNISSLKASKNTTSSITLKWNAVSGCDGYEIYKYNNSTKKYSLYKRQKTNSIIIEKLSAGTSYKFQVLAYKSKNKKKYSTSRTAITTATQPKTPVLNKLSTSKSILKVQWAKVTGATGYEIYVSQSKNGTYTKKSTINKQTITSQDINGLSKGTTYYVKIRAYKTVSGKKIYSNYSSIKSIKIK